MKHKPLNPGEGAAHRQDTAAAGTAISSIAHTSNSLCSSSSSPSSNRTAQLRNNYFSTGATRSSVHPMSPTITAPTARTCFHQGYQPLVTPIVSTKTSTLSVGFGPRPPRTPHMPHSASVGTGPRPPTTTNRDGTTNPRPHPAHLTPPSHAGTTQRVFRCDPARPVTAPGRDTSPAEAMDCPPSVAPGPLSRTAALTGPASGSLRGLTATGSSNGLRPTQYDDQPNLHPPQHPSPHQICGGRFANTGPSRRVVRSTPARPVTAMCRDSLPTLGATGRPPTVAPGAHTLTATTTGPATAPPGDSPEHVHTPRGAGTNTGTRPPHRAEQPRPSPPRPPPPRDGCPTHRRIQQPTALPRGTPGTPSTETGEPPANTPLPRPAPGP